MPPTHPIDRTRLVRYVSSNRVRYTVSAAYSSKLNPRNLEVDYYPAYHHTLADLAAFEFEGSITVGQQYNIWLSKATFDLYKVPQNTLDAVNYWFIDDNDIEDNSIVEVPQGAEEQAEDLEEHVEQEEVEEVEVFLDQGGTPSPPPMSSSPPRNPVSGRPIRNVRAPATDLVDYLTSDAARQDALKAEGRGPLTEEQLTRALQALEIRAHAVHKPSDATEADTSMETIRTVPDAQGKDNFPDMLLCHSYGVDVERPDDQTAVFGWKRRAQCKIRHQCFPLIMEIKGCPARSLRGDSLDDQLSNLMILAAGQLYDYVQAYFARDGCAKAVIAMIASGPYWRWKLVERGEIGRTVPGQGQPVTSAMENAVLQSAFVSKLESARIFILATDASDEELTRMRNEVLIPVIEEHHRYPSTMVPNPQLPKKKATVS